MVTVQVAVLPVQAPLQPPNAENVDGAPGASVNVTWLPVEKFALQVPGQLIPAGELTTVPVAGAVALAVTVSEYVFCWAKDAVTFWFELSVMVHVSELPLQPPLHPE